MTPAEQSVITAAIRWHVSHTPIAGPHDRSAYADRLRAVAREKAVRELHAAVEALVPADDEAVVA